MEVFFLCQCKYFFNEIFVIPQASLISIPLACWTSIRRSVAVAGRHCTKVRLDADAFLANALVGLVCDALATGSRVSDEEIDSGSDTKRGLAAIRGDESESLRLFHSIHNSWSQSRG